ncbi:hypothetical protein BHE74_00044068 [Ensete ventricosum]|nr:hypothetical protein BHE74_00044068 [Ensete ventricosum]
MIGGPTLVFVVAVAVATCTASRMPMEGAARTEYASSILLCPEDSSSILGFDDGEGEEQDLHGEAQRSDDLCQSPDKKSGFCVGILMDFTLQSEDCVVELVERESQHLPQGDYAERLLRGQLDMVARSDAIDWIQKSGLCMLSMMEI